jgi:uncharacterized membrane protein YdbT with pleckstrin-like domain
MIKSEVVIPKVWRSELKSLSLFLFFSVLAVSLSREFPGSVLTAPVWDFGNTRLFLTLPMWWFLPFLTLMTSIIRIYDVRHRIDARGLESRIGILSLQQRITRVRYEDIRNIEIEQTLLERILDIGRLEVSTSGTDGVEITLEGIAAPNEVRGVLERERDSRQKARTTLETKRTNADVEDIDIAVTETV